MQTLEGFGVRDEETAVQTVANMTHLGSVADDVVLDVIRVRAGRLAGSQSRAIARAVDLFDDLAGSTPTISGIWRGENLALTFERVSRLSHSEASTQVGEAAKTENRNAFMVRIREALNAIAHDEAEAGQLAMILAVFESISRVTLNMAQESADHRSSALQWALI